MNISTTFYDNLVELDMDKDVNWFPYPIISELNDRARMVLASWHEIPFPIPKYALIRNGTLIWEWNRIRPNDWNRLQYSLFSQVNKNIRVSVTSNQKKTFRILSKSPYLVLTGWRIWTTHTYFDLWEQK